MDENNFGEFLYELGVDSVQIQLDESVNVASKVVDAVAELKQRAISAGFTVEFAEEISLAFFRQALFGD
ncbi:hypothetical protein ADL27_32340 [Streptomyces sp. NRRL F-6602]|nr:hypothetical protein ADL27_32340 [Streptomyces sp. NRRL F-6602]